LTDCAGVAPVRGWRWTMVGYPPCGDESYAIEAAVAPRQGLPRGGARRGPSLPRRMDVERAVLTSRGHKPRVLRQRQCHVRKRRRRGSESVTVTRSTEEDDTRLNRPGANRAVPTIAASIRCSGRLLLAARSPPHAPRSSGGKRWSVPVVHGRNVWFDHNAARAGPRRIRGWRGRATAVRSGPSESVTVSPSRNQTCCGSPKYSPRTEYHRLSPILRVQAPSSSEAE
jgi:hypothetical protein